jgi:hypothetical protein
MKEAVRNRYELKKLIKDALVKRELDRVARYALESPRVVGILFNLSYDKDSLITWRAVEAMGVVAGALTERSREEGRELMKRLLWSITEESGGLGWSSIEMIAEVVVNSPQVFSDIPLLLPEYYDEPVFRDSVLYALWRIGSSNPELLEPTDVKEVVREALHTDSAYQKALALMIIEATGEVINYNDIKIAPDLLNDDTTVRVYMDGDFRARPLKEIARSIEPFLKSQ